MQRLSLILSITLSLAISSYIPAAVAADNAIVSLKQTAKAFATIAKEVSPAVVNIQSDQVSSDSIDGINTYESAEDTSHGRTPKIIREGSGFIISRDGYIVTNNHLVQDATKVTVKLLNNDEYKAKIIGTDPRSDIAVIKIEAKDLPTVQLGNSDQIEVGEWVVALGNPFGLSHSLSVGILSAKGRSYENFLQTDAAINVGNSGGPLLDLEGKVIGINTAILSSNGGNMGIGFAIPINMAKIIIDQLIKNGSVTRGYIGVQIQPINADLASSFNLKDKNGVLIAHVESNSPADKAGVKHGDVIVSLDGQKIATIADFRNSIANTKPGTKRVLGIMREKKLLQLQVSVGNLSDFMADEKNKKDTQIINKLGISVQNLTAEIASKLGVKADEGVVVSGVRPGSLGELAGLSRGSVILEVNRTKVNTVTKFISEVGESLKNKNAVVLLLVYDHQFGTRYVAIKIE